MNRAMQDIWTLALVGALATSACARSERAAPEPRQDAPGKTTIEPWDPVDKGFTGCASSG